MVLACSLSSFCPCMPLVFMCSSLRITHARALNFSPTPLLPLSLARSFSHAEIARMRNRLAEEEERNNSARARQIREVLSACALVSEGIRVRSE